MKIAIFHNLNEGGGLNQIKCITKELNKMNIDVDIYSHQKNKIPYSNKSYFYELRIPKNIIDYIYLVLYETKNIEKKISKKIINKKYNYTFVFPCHLQQCPNIINYLPKETTYYFYLESLREFYEKTSFDYYRPQKIISRLLRTLIKKQDYNNCKNVSKIISNSYYSQYQLRKIYKKESYVIQPGLENCKPQKIKITNKHNALSFGLISMLKGHHISKKIYSKVNIIGPVSHEKMSKVLDINKEITTPITNKAKQIAYNKNTFFFANQINEPFGLTTIEACSYKCVVIGKNEAGTCEIISNGVNGYLYDSNNIELAKEIFNNLNKRKTINISRVNKINWKKTIDNILYIIRYV